MIVLVLMIVIEIPLQANAQRQTPNAERRTKEDKNQTSEIRGHEPGRRITDTDNG
jgi:hypothetical protein